MTTVILDSPERVAYAQRMIGKLPLDKVWDCRIEPHHEKRSLKANARLWALHAKAAAHTGYSPDEMHEFALQRYFGYSEVPVTDPITGAGLTKRVALKRSSVRNAGEFGEFMEATEAWYVSEFGVFLGDDE